MRFPYVKLLWTLLFPVFIVQQTEAASPVLLGGVMALSAASSLDTLTSKKDSMLGDIFSSKEGVTLEKIRVSTEEDMNSKGAVKVHIVIVYDREVAGILKTMSASEYFKRVDQLIRDNQDKMKIFEIELVAKKRSVPMEDLEYPTDHLTPVACYIFANYSSPGEHRARIPDSWEGINMSLEKDDFHVRQAS
jgi:type VI secretion system protein